MLKVKLFSIPLSVLMCHFGCVEAGELTQPSAVVEICGTVSSRSEIAIIRTPQSPFLRVGLLGALLQEAAVQNPERYYSYFLNFGDDQRVVLETTLYLEDAEKVVVKVTSAAAAKPVFELRENVTQKVEACRQQ